MTFPLNGVYLRAETHLSVRALTFDLHDVFTEFCGNKFFVPLEKGLLTAGFFWGSKKNVCNKKSSGRGNSCVAPQKRCEKVPAVYIEKVRQFCGNPLIN